MNVNQWFKRRTRVVSVSILLSACVAMLGWSGWGAASEAPSGTAPPRPRRPRKAGRPPPPATRSGPTSPTRQASRASPGAASSSRPISETASTAAGRSPSRSTGGEAYRFQAHYRAENVAVPRRSIVAEIHWRDARGQKVPLDEPAVSGYLRGATAMAETEFPDDAGDGQPGLDRGLRHLPGPSRATQAVVELHLRWAPGGEVRWRERLAGEGDRPRSRNGAAGHRPLLPQGRQDARG